MTRGRGSRKNTFHENDTGDEDAKDTLEPPAVQIGLTRHPADLTMKTLTLAAFGTSAQKAMRIRVSMAWDTL